MRAPAPPLIAVTTSEMRTSAALSATAESDPPRPEMVLGLTYLEAVQHAGGVPVVVPPLVSEMVGPFLDRVDGLCLSGGPDIHPAAYGAEPHPRLGPTEPRQIASTGSPRSRSAAAPSWSSSRAVARCTSTCPTRWARP